MELAFASLMHFPAAAGKRCFYGTKLSFPAAPIATTRLSIRKIFPCLALPEATRPTLDNESDLESSKQHLLTVIQDTQRGILTTAHQRSSIEEALVRFIFNTIRNLILYLAFYLIISRTERKKIQLTWERCVLYYNYINSNEARSVYWIGHGQVSVERYDAGAPVDLGKLDGTWRLQYTSAPDVLILLESSARFPFFQVGQIFQKFECRNQSAAGIVQNVVRWSIRNLLEEQEGATLLVSAKFSIVSLRNIYLQFEEIAIQNISISEELQTVIAPAILPRSFLSLQILQFIRSFKAQFPVRNPGRQRVGGLYYLSYLDGNMLLGRADGGGVFVFTKAQPLV